MSRTQLAEALAPLASRMPRPVREREILRIAGSLAGAPDTVARSAIREVIAWAQPRAGTELPPGAWQGEEFESVLGGRNLAVVRIASDAGDIWSLRGEDPDKRVPQRIWTTEITIGRLPDRAASLGVRLLVSTNETGLSFQPSAPGVVRQIMDRCGLQAGDETLGHAAIKVDGAGDAQALTHLILDPMRQLPVVVVAETEANGPTLIDPDELAARSAGLAHVHVASQEACWALTEAFGKRRSVFDGAVRTYLPGFDETADPYAHPLVLARALQHQEGKADCVQTVLATAATASLQRVKLGSDVLAFAMVRNARLKAETRRIQKEGGTDRAQLDAALAQIRALEADIDEKQALLNYYSEEFEQERARAEAAEAQARSSGARVVDLLATLEARGDDPDSEAEIPTAWSDFVDWCDRVLAGRVTLTPSARKGVKSPLYSSPETAARCLLWLASTCRQRRIDGGGSLRDEAVLDGIRNTPCGGDTYETWWQGQRHRVDWHLKTGGNTRDPNLCIRVYYFWHEPSQQIIVADMPAHRRTDAT